MSAALGVAWLGLLARLRDLVDLEGSARDCGALLRRRGVADAGVADLSDVALLYRLQGAEGWLVRELLSRELGALGAGVAVPGGWRVRLVDGGMAGPGGKALFRLHATFDLAARRFAQLELTDGAAAESLARHTTGPGEVLVADRFYAKARGIHALVAQGGHVVIRRGLTACRLVAADGRKLDAKTILALARAHPTLDLPVLVSPPPGQHRRADTRPADHPPQAARGSRAGAGKGRAQGGAAGLCRPAEADRGRRPIHGDDHPAAQAMDADAVCALYRLRWQIEVAFKRLKSLMGLESFVAREPRLARAAVAAKLILAILAESLLGRVLALFPLRLTRRPRSGASCVSCTNG
jgi:hypothetical protein